MHRILASSILWLAIAGLLAAQNGPPDRVAVIIGFNAQPGPAEQALVRAAGGVIRHTYRIIPAIAATLPAPAVQALSNHRSVSIIEADAELHALDEYSSAWGVQKIAAQAVHAASIQGNGVNICIIDTGIDTTHQDLTGRYAGGYDFVNNDSDPTDDNGHGTHVAGTIAAVLDGAGVVGAAPQARIYAYKILDSSGNGSFSDAIAAVQACVDVGGKVTNNSYGASGDPGTQVKAAFDNAYNAGVLHVAAAGNATLFTCNSVSYPAAYDSVVAVAATDSSDQVASWSCRGPQVELAAPGVSIYSTYMNGGYATMSGTSMASPHVAGLAALVFTCGGGFDNVGVRNRMQQTVLDLGTAGRDSSYGYGRVQADKAALNCTTPPPPGEPPAAPSNLKAVAGKTNVKLTWTDNSSNETGFEVESCTGAGCTNFARITTVSANTTSYTKTGLARKTTYSYRVRAVNASGQSGYSNTVTTKTN
jgi:subtilisin